MWRRPGTGHRRRRHRQDVDPRVSSRLPDRAGRSARTHLAADVFTPRGARDAVPRRPTCRAQTRWQGLGRDVPRHRQSPPAPIRSTARPVARLHRARPGRYGRPDGLDPRRATIRRARRRSANNAASRAKTPWWPSIRAWSTPVTGSARSWKAAFPGASTTPTASGPSLPSTPAASAPRTSSTTTTCSCSGVRWARRQPLSRWLASSSTSWSTSTRTPTHSRRKFCKRCAAKTAI